MVFLGNLYEKCLYFNKEVVIFGLCLFVEVVFFVFVDVIEVFVVFVGLRFFFILCIIVEVVVFFNFGFVSCEIIFFCVFWLCMFICVFIVMKFLLCYFKLILIVKVFFVFVGSRWNVVMKGGFFLRLIFLIKSDLM